MDLQNIWFILIAVLYTGYFVLEGFDLGVGILLPFLGKDESRRRMMINSIGPHWDGNEVWLITAGGATFAAFPQWYATLFSGFYLPLFIMLVALIARGVAFGTTMPLMLCTLKPGTVSATVGMSGAVVARRRLVIASAFIRPASM